MNTYTIKEIRDKFNIPSSTLRYYEETGLFPRVERTETNQRIYTDEHIDRLHAINCFKRTGLSISKMYDFFEFSKNLPCHIDDIIFMMEDHERNIICQMEKMQQDLKHIQQKVRYYHKVKTSIERGIPCPCFEEC
jgi:Predicted transcriptional regulators